MIISRFLRKDLYIQQNKEWKTSAGHDTERNAAQVTPISEFEN